MALQKKVDSRLTGSQALQAGTREFTILGITTYHVDLEQLDAFVSTVHGDKLQQMGDEVGPMTCGYLLRSRIDPEIVIHLTLMNVQSEQDMTEAQVIRTHPLRMEILEDVKPYLLTPPEAASYQLVSTMQYKQQEG
jgi:hypothetical protein